MLKQTLTILTAGVSLTVTAFADIGDTYESSNQRFSQTGIANARYGTAYYEMKYYFITEFFNEDGICDSIVYYRKPVEEDIANNVVTPYFGAGELDTLIALNAGGSGSPFRPVPSNYGLMWKTDDGTSTAYASVCPIGQQKLWAVQITLASAETRLSEVYKLREADRHKPQPKKSTLKEPKVKA